MTVGYRVGELCAGYGGIRLGLDLAGIETDLAWWADNDPRPAAVMAAHHPTAPNLGDITEITDPPTVDIVTAGFPCQPVSTAGERRGVNDERWLVDDVCRVARLCGSRMLILENVAGILTANGGDAMARVCEAMAREGFRRWEWGTLRASDVGAPHRRKRWFCVAHTDSIGGGPLVGQVRPRESDTDRGPAPHADSLGLGRVGVGRVPGNRDPQPGLRH